MSGRKTLADDRRRRKLITIGWTLGLAGVIGFLIYRELTAVLYILATLGVTALLVVVALSDLSHGDNPGAATARNSDASNAGTGSLK